MKRTAAISLALICVVCLAALATDASIGPLAHSSALGSLFAFAAGGVALAAAFVALAVSVLRTSSEDRRAMLRRVGIAAAVVVATIVLASTSAPRRVAFAASRGAFDRLAASVPAVAAPPTPLGRRIGLFEVDEYAVDAAGGAYFRVGSSSLLETTSCGFCVRPDPKTTPFGASGYALTSLGGGWFWFTANDDWY